MSQNNTSVYWPRFRPLLTLVFAVSMGCGPAGDQSGTGGATPGASGGAVGTGGASTSGGAPGSGGSVGSGGAASGGRSGTGGASTTGGNSGTTGGAPGSGGETSRTGGSSGMAGSNGSGGSAGRAGGTGGSAGAAGATGGAAGGSGAGAKMSEGCGKAPATLKSATANQATPTNSISVGGTSRQFLVRWPTNYDNTKAYPLHLGLHGANGNLQENGRDNFGLWSLSKNTVIFVTLGAVNGLWSATTDLAYTEAVLKQVESELCIDTSRVVLEGFSQGAAMSWYLTGSRPGVFRAVVGHSGGGVGGIPTLSPVAYLGSLGTGEGGGQNTQTDQFAKANGCTIDTLPRATTGTHVCTAYKGCKDGFPTTWCSYDGGHGFQDTDSGSSGSWVPQVVWQFLMPLLF